MNYGIVYWDLNTLQNGQCVRITFIYFYDWVLRRRLYERNQKGERSLPHHCRMCSPNVLAPSNVKSGSFRRCNLIRTLCAAPNIGPLLFFNRTPGFFLDKISARAAVLKLLQNTDAPMGGFQKSRKLSIFVLTKYLVLS